MIDIRKHSVTKFYDIAEIERAKKNKIYPADSILLQVSATKGQLHYLSEPKTIDEKFAVIRPKVYGKYLYHVMKEDLPLFLEKYQTGLNIQIDIFKFYKIDIHTDTETQIYVASIMDQMEELTKQEEDFIKKLKDFKTYHLDNMFY